MPLAERAPAKINLGLHVLRERPDGYHDVETVLHKIDWFDTVTAQPSDELSMTCSDPSLPTDHENLCLQAAHALAETFEARSGATLHLEKRVPHGAGLGGGSSDAAATLRLLTRLWDLETSPQELQELARSIGADVPFFLSDTPAAYATGRGDEITPLYADSMPYQLSYPILVVVPPERVSTPSAYTAVTPNDTDRPNLPPVVQSNNLSEWRSGLTNDFEQPVSRRYRSVAAARAWLKEQGAGYVSLSGSGSAVYGVFESLDRTERAMDAGRERPGEIHLMEPSLHSAQSEL